MENNKLQKSHFKATSKKKVYVKNHQIIENNEVSFTDLWMAIWSGKIIILAITFMFAVISITYAVTQPNIYRATTILSPSGDQNGAGGLAKMAGQFGGLASLAGISLGDGVTDKTGLALEVLKSRYFIENFIHKYEILVPLMAVKSWEQSSDTLVFDDEIYDLNAQLWVRDVKKPKTMKPSNWEAYEAFKNIFSISTDKETGMINLSIEHYSPKVAKLWLQNIVTEINFTMREQDKNEAQRSIDFLTKKLQETQLIDMQTVFYQLIEEQTKTIMLAEVSNEYVLKTIDPANTPDEKSKPKRAIIVVLGTIFGWFCAVLFILIRHFYKTSDDLTDENLKDQKAR